MMRILVILFLIVIVSCSRTSVVLRFADDFIAYEISDQFNFSGKQDSASDVVSEQFVRELKIQLIPYVVAELKKVSEKVQATPKLEVSDYEKEIQQLLSSFETKMKSLQPLFTESMLKVIDQMTEENWKFYLAEFGEKNSKILKEKSKSRLLNSLERFFGRLTPSQLTLVQDFEIENKFDVNVRISNRQATISRFKQEMGPTFSKEKLKEVASSWIKNPNSYGDPNAQSFYNKRRAAIVQLVAQILYQKTEKQRDHLSTELKKIETDLLESLSKEQIIL